MRVFADRADAGRRLARRLVDLRGSDVVVLGLARGGVPVAAQVSTTLGAPLEALVALKLGVPWQPELAMGAISEDDATWLDLRLIAHLDVTPAQVERVVRRQKVRLDERVARLRARPRTGLTGRTVLVVDDGIATGATASVACQVVRARGAARVIVAAPVGAPDAVRQVQGTDTLICLSAPREFGAVGNYYRDFTPTTDDEVIELLSASRTRLMASER